MFRWVIKILMAEGLLEGQSISIDATTLEANAAMKGSNAEWESPADPDARITKMKDGRTNLAHKAEHAVDLSSGALLAITLQPASEGDTSTIRKTLEEAQSAAHQINARGVEEVVADKGYHSGQVLQDLRKEGVRSYIPEPDRGTRNWKGKEDEQQRTYENRRRIRGNRGKRLQKIRSELTERSFAHMYDTGGMRRVHLRGRQNILKRLLVHGAAFNLSLILRTQLGVGKPRQLRGCISCFLRSTCVFRVTPNQITWLLRTLHRKVIIPLPLQS